MDAKHIVERHKLEEMKRQVQHEAGTMLEVSTDRPLIGMDLLEKVDFKGVALFGNHINLLAKEPVVAHKKWREIVRDRLFFSLAFIVPAFPMIRLGYGISMDAPVHVYLSAPLLY